MSRRLLRLLIGLYPRKWRRRYGDELRDLVSDMADHGDQTQASLAFGLIANAAVERIHGSRRRAVTALGLAAALGAATMVALNAAPGHEQPQRLALITPHQQQAGRYPGLGQTCFVSADAPCSAIPCREFVSASQVAPAQSLAVVREDLRALPSHLSRARTQCALYPSVHGQTFLVRNG